MSPGPRKPNGRRGLADELGVGAWTTSGAIEMQEWNRDRRARMPGGKGPGRSPAANRHYSEG